MYKSIPFLGFCSFVALQRSGTFHRGKEGLSAAKTPVILYATWLKNSASEPLKSKKTDFYALLT